MTHSALKVHREGMRTAAFALACLLGAAATTAAAGEDAPAYNLPPFPSGPPAPSPGPTAPSSASSGLRAYAPSPARAESPPHPPRGRTCFSQSETRDKIVQRRLTDPVSATRAGRAEGETLRTRLCRWKQDELVYEVFVLRRDGRIIRVYINAQNGQAVSPADMADHK